MSRVVGVIPARYASSRFPGKPLAMVAGKPLLQWVIEGAKKSRWLEGLIVATDHPEIANLAKQMGVEVAMTDSNLPSGTDRIWAAIHSRSVEVVVNIQGDEPLVTGELVDVLVQPMLQDCNLEMATLAHPLSPEELRSDHCVKVVVNQKDEALYFSRFAIPYSRLRPASENEITGALKHIGLYAYRKNFLETFCRTAPVEMEEAESLEQLRALFLGARIKVLRTEYRSLGVDTPEDVVKIERMLGAKS